MFYSKKSVIPKVKSIVVDITDFSKGLNFNLEENILDPNYCVNSYNFAYKKGVLTEGYGFETLTCPNYEDETFAEVYLNPDHPVPDFSSVWFYKMYDDDQGGRIDKLMYYAENNTRLYFHRALTIAPMINKFTEIMFPERPSFTYNYKFNNYDYNLIGSEKLGVVMFDGYIDPVQITNCPNMSSLCVDKGKMFCTVYGDRNCIYYHVGDNIQEWTTETDDYNGKIEMNDNRGKINKVLSFLGYVFAIRDYGISKITNYEGKLKFDITHLSLYGNKIYENTVNICGDKIFMLTKDGIASFNGVTSKVLNLGVNEFLKGVNNDNARAVFHSGKYYLACKLNFNDNNSVGCESLENGFINNALIILDVQTLDYDIVRGIDISGMESVQINKMDKVALVLNSIKRDLPLQLTNNGCFYDVPLRKEWNSPLTDLGYSNKVKLIKDISLLSLYDLTLTIYTEKESKTFKISGKNTLSKLRVNLKGKQIGIKIESETEKAYVSNLKFNIDLFDYEFTRF